MIGKYPQVATVWEFDGGLDDFGNRSYKSPRQIDVRWERQTNLFLNSDGNEARAESTNKFNATKNVIDSFDI